MKQLTAEGSYNKEIEELMKEVLANAIQSDREGRLSIAKFMREEADKQEKDIVLMILTKLAEKIESMEDPK